MIPALCHLALLSQQCRRDGAVTWCLCPGHHKRRRVSDASDGVAEQEPACLRSRRMYDITNVLVSLQVLTKEISVKKCDGRPRGTTLFLLQSADNLDRVFNEIKTRRGAHTSQPGVDR
eukprot:34596-Prorocentrum_minimum.AAC.3